MANIKIIPVIHYEHEAQVMRNAERVVEAGCDGALLIHMGGANHLLPAAALAIRRRWPQLPLGINGLGVRAMDALRASIELGLDMTWTDEQPTHSDNAPWREADELADMLKGAPGHTMFVGVAFKHQRHEPSPVEAATRAIGIGMVPTTSGAATGVAAEPSHVEALRAGIGRNATLAVASGITPENVHLFGKHVSHILVATGVSSSFHELDTARLTALRDAHQDA